MTIAFPQIVSHLPFLADVGSTYASAIEAIGHLVDSSVLRRDIFENLAVMDLACRPTESLLEVEKLYRAFQWQGSLRQVPIFMAMGLPICIVMPLVAGRNESMTWREYWNDSMTRREYWKTVGFLGGCGLAMSLTYVGVVRGLSALGSLTGFDILSILPAKQYPIFDRLQASWGGHCYLVRVISNWKTAGGMVFTQEYALKTIEKFKLACEKLERWDPSLTGYTQQIVDFYTDLAARTFADGPKVVPVPEFFRNPSLQSV